MKTDEAIQRNPKGCWRMCAGATLVLFCIVDLTIFALAVIQVRYRKKQHSSPQR